jgi:hypothetical protein
MRGVGLRIEALPAAAIPVRANGSVYKRLMDADAGHTDVEAARVAVVVTFFAVRFRRMRALSVLADIVGADVAVTAARRTVRAFPVGRTRDRVAAADLRQVALVRGRTADGARILKKFDDLAADALDRAAWAVVDGAILASRACAGRGKRSQSGPGQPCQYPSTRAGSQYTSDTVEVMRVHGAASVA